MDGDATVLRRPHTLALLRGGPRAAVLVSVVALHLRGAVEAGGKDTVEAVPGAGEDVTEPLERAVLEHLRDPAQLRYVHKDLDVRVAVADLWVELAEAGLTGFGARANHEGRRRVRALRLRHPLPTARHGLTDEAKLRAVALHGEAALRTVAPRFALRVGPVRRVTTKKRRGGSGGSMSGSGGASHAAGGHGCGGGGGGCGGGGF